MNKEKEELLKNPLVKEIAQTFAALLNETKETLPNKFWDDFVRENTKPKEWEILSVIDEKGIIYNVVGDRVPLLYAPLNYILNVNIYKINSVKRLSDGEVFTVGDNFRVHPGIHLHKIHSFRIDGDALAVLAEDFPKYTYYLPHLIKEKQAIFTTFDSKPVYEGDEYWIVFQNYSGKKSEATEDCLKTKHWDELVKFSTREKAEEYILMNKPCLSVNDVISFTLSESVHIKRLQEELTNLAKSKI